jgi:cation transport ATPase
MRGACWSASLPVLHGRIADVAWMVELSRRTLANIRANSYMEL